MSDQCCEEAGQEGVDVLMLWRGQRSRDFPPGGVATNARRLAVR